MQEFCGCENPDIQSSESGMSIVVQCKKCGQSAATTNTRRLEELNPWIDDDNEYQVIVSPDGLDKITFVKVMKKKLPLSTKFITTLFLDHRDSVAFQGTGQEFYEFCQFLNENKVSFVTRPECSYVHGT